MTILNTVRGWWASRGQHQREAYAESRGFTPEDAEEQEELKDPPLATRLTGGMPEGTGIGPTGTPTDFTADEKPPRY
jgi:hypothetical protein